MAAHHRPVRHPDHRPGRRRRHRAPLAGPARHPAPARARAVLRLTGPQPAPAHDPGRRARRPLPRAPDRHDRPGGAARPELADHRHRPSPPASSPGSPGAGQVTSITTAPRQRRNGRHHRRLQLHRRSRSSSPSGRWRCCSRCSIFIGTATRLAAARREQRFAAMRLVGATPRQVSVISAVEASIAALGRRGRRLRPVLPAAPGAAGHARPSPASRSPPATCRSRLADILLVAIGVPAAAAVAARVALRRVQISPLGVTRRVTPPAPRAYRLIPLLAGIAELAYFVGVGHPKSTSGQIWRISWDSC